MHKKSKNIYSWTPSENVLSCFLREHNLLESEIKDGSILNRNHPYRIIFDNQEEGSEILAQLPLKVLVSFQLFQGQETVAIIRKLKTPKERKE
jgi:hypothetical protein